MGKTSSGFQYPFPTIPQKWTQEEKHFATGIRRIFDIIFATNTFTKLAYPVGAVYLTTKDKVPFTFGTWSSVTTGITGVNGWKRIK